VGHVVDKVALKQIFSEYFGSLANFNSSECCTFTIICHLGLVQ
jgi:hypothetical protein